MAVASKVFFISSSLISCFESPQGWGLNLNRKLDASLAKPLILFRFDAASQQWGRLQAA
jgi:hypothetical protein